MFDRVVNFGAGPAILPPSVLEEARRDLIALPGIGISPLEISHRSPWFEGVIAEAELNLRELLTIPDTYAVAFLQGGASLQFAMVPINMLRGGTADHVVTGTWGQKAATEAARLGEVHVLWSGTSDGFVRTPGPEELDTGDGGAYLHITSNETIHGVQWPVGSEPAVPVLVCDASSDLLSRPLEVQRYGVIYAGAQKNAGPAGVTMVIIRRDLLSTIPDGLPTMLDYRTYTEHGSLHNTPPVFSIYVLMLVTRWLRDEVGGLERQFAINQEKAGLLYAAIDDSDGAYTGHADVGSRSLMNVTFRLRSRELERTFLEDAAGQGLVELRGHRSVGGIRASLYNAMPIAGVRALAAFMEAFARRTA